MIAFHTLTWHYTATYPDQDAGRAEIDAMHRARGFAGIGYHGGFRVSGLWEDGRPLTKTGAHVRDHNTGNLGYYTSGGLDRKTGPDVGVDTRTREQIAGQIEKTREALTRWPTIKHVIGHRDQVATQCPGYDVAAWWAKETGNRVPVERLRAPDAPTVTHGLLKRGSRGKGVQMLQDALTSLGHGTGGVDGVFGRKTEAAVREFQARRGIDVDGTVGPMTWTALGAAAPKTTKRRLLKRGSWGQDVRVLQEALTSLGHSTGGADGVFGPRTERAVREFQTKRKIGADGRVGQMTWAALESVGRS